MKQNVVITGTTSGLGMEIMYQFGHYGTGVFDVYGVSTMEPTTPVPSNYIDTFICDITKPEDVAQLGDAIDFPVDILINNAGVNFIDWMQFLKVEDWDRVMNTNARGIWLVTKVLLENLKEVKGTVVNVVSNAMKVPMTHSIVYNASKGAAGIMTRQMARELQREHGICVFGICPNKLAGTEMSDYIDCKVCEIRGWTRVAAKAYQQKSLLAGFETQPDQIAELLVWLLSEPRRHKYLTGCLLELGL